MHDLLINIYHEPSQLLKMFMCGGGYAIKIWHDKINGKSSGIVARLSLPISMFVKFASYMQGKSLLCTAQG